MDLGEKLAAARKGLPGRPSQEAMAERLAMPGVNRDTIASIESGRRKNVPVEIVEAYAKIARIAVGWFYDPNDTPPVPESFLEPPQHFRKNAVKERETLRYTPEVLVQRRGMRPLPVLATIAAGDPWMQNAEGYHEEIPDWGNEFERWGRVVEGESMLPTLKPGDIAIFENRKAEPNQVVHAFDDGMDTVKCWRGTAQGPLLAPFNEDYESIDAKTWNVKGVCVGRIRKGPYGTRSYTEFPGGLSWGMRLIDF